MITQSELKEILHYNQDTGIFTWLKYKQRPSKIGSEAGWVRKDSYKAISIMSKQYFAHRLAWLYVTGKHPKNQIDHIDGNKLNNKFSNLRECTAAQNSQNFKNSKFTNKAQLLGVNVKGKKFRARIGINKKVITIGTLNNAQEAHNAYLITKRKLHEFCTI